MLVLSWWYFLLCSPLKKPWLYLLYYCSQSFGLRTELSVLLFIAIFRQIFLSKCTAQKLMRWYFTPHLSLLQISLWPPKLLFCPRFWAQFIVIFSSSNLLHEWFQYIQGTSNFLIILIVKWWEHYTSCTGNKRWIVCGGFKNNTMFGLHVITIRQQF